MLQDRVGHGVDIGFRSEMEPGKVLNRGGFSVNRVLGVQQSLPSAGKSPASAEPQFSHL